MIFRDSEKNQPDKILSLGDYNPYWIDKDNRIKNPDFKRSWDGRILDIKEAEGGKRTVGVRFFFAKLNPILGEDFTIATVPSSNPENTESGIRELAIMLARLNRIDATSCLLRRTPISKLSHGGDRSLDVHLNSIDVVNPHLIQGREVLLLDDVTTSGNSLRACQMLLKKVGVRTVQCLALGCTTRNSVPIEDSPLNLEEFQF
jgi:hypothetical protein